MTEMIRVWGPDSLEEFAAVVEAAITPSARLEAVGNTGMPYIRFNHVPGNFEVFCFPWGDRRPGDEEFGDYYVSIENGSVEENQALMAAICTHLTETTSWAVVPSTSDDATGFPERPPTR